ncbi:MAG TPA: hypothetical protein VI072_05610 [Polyangiaceae bacterium]
MTLPALNLLHPEVCPFRCLGWNNVMIVSWHESINLAAIKHLSKISDDLLAIYPSVSAIHLAASDIGLPSSEVRPALREMMARYAPHTACLAVVLEGSGFWASTVRSLITGMRMVAPRAFAMRMHENIAEVCEWLPREHQRRTGVSLDPEGLRLALEQTKKR